MFVEEAREKNLYEVGTQQTKAKKERVRQHFLPFNVYILIDSYFRVFVKQIFTI